MNCSRLASKLISPLYSVIIKIRSPIIHLSAISSDVEECRFNYCIHSDISSHVCQISIFNSIKDSLTIEYRNIKKLFLLPTQFAPSSLLPPSSSLLLFFNFDNWAKNRSSATETLLLSHEAMEMTANDKCKWIPPHPKSSEFPTDDIKSPHFLLFHNWLDHAAATTQLSQHPNLVKYPIHNDVGRLVSLKLKIKSTQ